MKPPTIRNSVHDPDLDVTYHVMAYRKLTTTEVLEQIALARSGPKRIRPKRGHTYTLLTIIGYDQ